MSTIRSMNGWLLPINRPITDREVLILVKYARDVIEQEIAFCSIVNQRWYYKGLPDDEVVRPVLNRVLAWRELPDVPDCMEELL